MLFPSSFPNSWVAAVSVVGLKRKFNFEARTGGLLVHHKEIVIVHVGFDCRGTGIFECEWDNCMSGRPFARMIFFWYS
jgi:hypothetical protein